MEDFVRITEVRKLSWLSRIAICIYLIISVFEPYINGTIGSITKYYILVLIFFILLCDAPSLKLSKFALPYIIWLFYKFISLLWSTDYSTPKIHYVSQIGMILLLVVITSVKFDLKTLHLIEITYCFSSGLLGLMSFPFSTSYHGNLANRQIISLFGIEQDPNNLATILLIGITISLDMIFKTKGKKIFYWSIFVINSLACLRTGSRAGMITLVFIVIVTFFFGSMEKKPYNFIKKFFAVTVSVVALMFIIQKYLPEDIFLRLFVDNYSGGSYRDILWGSAWKLYTSNIITVLFGAGWGTVTAYSGMELGVHNTFLTMLCDVGLIGTLLFIIPVVKASVYLFKTKRTFPVILLLSQFIPSFFIDAINKRFFWNAVFILFIYYFRYSYADSLHKKLRGQI